MRSDAFDQQRELRMKGGWRGGEGGLLVVVVGRRGFGDESAGAEDGRDNDSGRRWEQTLMEMMMVMTSQTLPVEMLTEMVTTTTTMMNMFDSKASLSISKLHVGGSRRHNSLLPSTRGSVSTDSHELMSMTMGRPLVETQCQYK